MVEMYGVKMSCNHDKEVSCPLDGQGKELKCAKNEWNVININQGRRNHDSNGAEGLQQSRPAYRSRCIGPSWPKGVWDFQQGIVMKAFECKGGPCGDSKKVCIRYK